MKILKEKTMSFIIWQFQETKYKGDRTAEFVDHDDGNSNSLRA
jgi:hypothetical protein